MSAMHLGRLTSAAISARPRAGVASAAAAFTAAATHFANRAVIAITLGVLLTDLWPWVRKRPNAPKGNDDA